MRHINASIESEYFGEKKTRHLSVEAQHTYKLKFSDQLINCSVGTFLTFWGNNKNKDCKTISIINI